LKRRYILAIFFVAVVITFCGTATAADISPTTVNDQVTTSSVQDNPTVDTSNPTTCSTQNNIQDNQPDTNPTTVNDQTTHTTTKPNTASSTQNNLQDTQSDTNPQTTPNVVSSEDPVVITFDDGFESTYTVAFPIMQQYGIKGTVYVVPAWIGSQGYLTLAELTTLHNAGWTIAIHTWDHPALPTLTTQQITTELQSTITWLNQNGFADGAYHLAYPYGQYNNNVLQVVSTLGIKTARTVDWGTIDPDGTIYPYGTKLNYLELPIILMRSDTSRNDWQSDLDRSIAQSGTAIFLFHDIVTGNPNILEDVTVTTFRTVIEYINQTGVKTETISQWYNERENINSLSIGTTTDKTNYNPGENVVYHLDILNNGANAATNVVVRDTLPAGLTFVSSTNNGIYSNGVITWNLANLAANSHFIPSFTATVNQGTEGQSIQNTASVTSTQIPTPVTSQITIHINRPNTAAEIIINFDDGLESVYTVAFPIMQQYGIKGTVYVVTDWIGDSGYLTQAELTALHNAGWTIANHSYRHWWLPELTTTQITTEIQTAITYLTNNGFQDGAYHFAYPYGEYDSRALQIASTLGIKTARTIESGTIDPNGNINYLELPSNGFTRTTTTAQWKAWVDQAITTQKTSIILLHSIVSNPSITEDVSVTTFTAFIQYVAQKGVKTLTINQWYNEMNNPLPDLTVSNLVVPSSPQLGTTYPVTFKVTNSGSANAGSFLVSLMDGTISIGQQTITSLNSGQSTTVSFNWIPTATGSRTISATADVNNAVTESNEANNSITQQVTVVTQSLTNLLSTNQQGVETDLTGFDSYLCTLTRDTSVKYAGSASAKAVSSGGFSQIIFADDAKSITAGTNYIANAYVRANVATLASQTITIIYDWYKNGSHLAYSYQWVNLSTIGVNTWYYLQLQATAPAGADTVYMSIGLGNANSGDSFWYDNGVLHAVT
jgi:uncharacterized repeat protein (TIGR01451 family)